MDAASRRKKRGVPLEAFGALLVVVALLVGGALAWRRAHTESRPVARPATARTAPRADRGLARSAGSRVDEVEAAATIADASRAPRPFFCSWGGATIDQVGRARPTEGNPMGPTSLAVGRSGDVYILDTVNGRIVRRDADGTARASLPVDLRAPEDLAVGSDGSLAVLDRQGDRAVAVYSPSGVLRGKLPLAGAGIQDPGELTGVFADGTDVYVERAHDRLVRIGDVHGRAASARTELAGRPSRDGTALLGAAIVDAATGIVRISSFERSSGRRRFQRDIRLWPVVRAILLLDSDAAGTIYFAAETRSADSRVAVVLSCLDPSSGDVVGGAVLPPNTLPEETVRDLAVLDEGGVVHAERSDAGVAYRYYSCR